MLGHATALRVSSKWLHSEGFEELSTHDFVNMIRLLIRGNPTVVF